MVSKKAIVVAISGGSGSGKTTIAHQLRDHLQHSVKSVILYQDNYYKDQKELPLHRRALVNYDEPKAFDWVLMKRDLENLKNGKAVDTPLYDFTNHTRSAETHHIEPVDVVIFEGFMSLHQNVLNYSDIRLFVDTPSDERLLRRMIRDINERGRSFESVASQWRSTVRPMYRAHVAPQKESAHIIIPWYEISNVAVKAIKGSILDFVNAPADKPHLPVPTIASVNVKTEASAYTGDLLLTKPVSTGTVPPMGSAGLHSRQPRQPQNQAGQPRQQSFKPVPADLAQRKQHPLHSQPPRPAMQQAKPAGGESARPPQQGQPRQPQQQQQQRRPVGQQQAVAQPRTQGTNQPRQPRQPQDQRHQQRQQGRSEQGARQQQVSSDKAKDSTKSEKLE